MRNPNRMRQYVSSCIYKPSRGNQVLVSEPPSVPVTRVGPGQPSAAAGCAPSGPGQRPGRLSLSEPAGMDRMVAESHGLSTPVSAVECPTDRPLCIVSEPSVTAVVHQASLSPISRSGCSSTKVDRVVSVRIKFPPINMSKTYTV